MKLVIFGASGRTGIPLVKQALDAGHEVTAFVRDANRLPIQHSRLSLTVGDIRDAAPVREVIIGADGVICAIGQTQPPTRGLLEVAMTNIVEAMHQNGVRRLVYLTGAGVRDPGDRPGLADKVMGVLLKVLAGEVLEDSIRAASIIRESGLDWVIVRASRLSDDPAKGAYRSGYTRPGFGSIARADVASFMLSQLADDTYLRRMPIVSY